MAARRTIEEWTTLFELEPSMRHVFVEGESDQRLLEAAFKSVARADVSVRLIQEVSMPERLTRPTPFNSGNRAKLLAFASQLETLMNRPIENLRCIVDLDCGAILPMTQEERFVCYTDSANMLMHFAEYEPLRADPRS